MNDADFERLEAKVDLLTGMVRTLVQALAEDEDPEAADVLDLEGRVSGKERDQTQSLG